MEQVNEHDFEEEGSQVPSSSGVVFAPITTGVPFKAFVQEPSPVNDRQQRKEISRQSFSGKVTQNSGPGKHKRSTSGPLAAVGQDSAQDEELGIETTTPPARRSVQFVRRDIPESIDGGNKRPDATDADGLENGPKDSRASTSLFSKLRALAYSSNYGSHVRSPSDFTLGGESIDERCAVFTPDSEYPPSQYADSPQAYASESDADSEHSAPAGTSNREVPPRKRRKSRRPRDGGVQTAPATPKTPFMRDGRPNVFSFNSQGSQGSGDRRTRTLHLPRRSTMTDLRGDERHGVSEDEGRDRLSNERPPRRGHGLRGLSYGGGRKSQTPDAPRPSTFRRAFTGLGGSSEVTEGGVSPWKLRSERTASLSAAKWRQIKAGLKMIGRQRKAENQIDHAKSAELLAELTAGVPAALMLASMFQRDEHGHRRIPILLEQLKVKLTDSKTLDTKSADRHMLFRIEIEYGNGSTRMKWVINRTLRDFTNLHAKYKFQISAKKYIKLRGDDRAKLPRFPRSAFPFLRGLRDTGISDSDEDEEGDRDMTATSGNEANGTERHAGMEGRTRVDKQSGAEKFGKKKRRGSISMMRRKSSVPDPTSGAAGASTTALDLPSTSKKDLWPERQRRKLEIYLQQMIRYVIFRPESNRLCKFLELSALGIRLAAEGGYHGKEGFLIIQSGNGVDFRRALKPSLVKSRHHPKWFLVRHSYIVCVDSPEEMIIYDVFLVDSDFRMQAKKSRIPLRDQNAKALAKTAKESAAHPQHHSLKLFNSERKLKLLAKHERQLNQFQESIQYIISSSPWAQRNRFDSFAPMRSNVFARWLVDGRDYMWNVSRAISQAKDVIYIHDWWLSPELYMRRPPAISQKWRLDRLLQRKAREGVKVFVIVYRNINSAIPIDSEYTKFSLLDLDANVFVQRSPNQIRQNTFFWAHHEKICIVDHFVAFVGGIDLCLGRWDTPEHRVADDKLTGYEDSDMPKDSDHCQLWPGKDYSNPRVQDFYALDKPYEEMYDRSKIPRMPWHDISMQVVGQPARDLTRHFVQRWNYILRQRKPTRPTPFLLPPPDFDSTILDSLGLKGTCEVQILRSCGMWSMGTPDRVEHSIMNAYVNMIQESDYFVYIENQFFISSCEFEGTKIENTIGEALVERIIRAHKHDEAWRAVILIPLMPGFQNTVDSQDGTSVRLIMQCQFRSINRGESSIFGRLLAEGIDPEDYIQFYSLRSWGQVGPSKTIVTEQLYIHAKCMVVDDRIAIIGSANINERSMLGNRDSECAAVVRDTDMMWSSMNGEPYKVGRFPHTLRMRLMREHLGIDVDNISEEEDEGQSDEEFVPEMDDYFQIQPEDLSDSVAPRAKANQDVNSTIGDSGAGSNGESGNGGRGRKLTTTTTASAASNGGMESRSDILSIERQGNMALPPPRLPRMSTYDLGLPALSQLPALPETDDGDISGPSLHRVFSSIGAAALDPALSSMKRPQVDKDCMCDPLNDDFYNDIWHTVAENNTTLFRSIFRCMPDNEVKTWKEYKEYTAYGVRFFEAQSGGKSKDKLQQEVHGTSGPPGSSSTAEKLRMLGPIGETTAGIGDTTTELAGRIKEKLGGPNQEPNHPLGTVEDWADDATRENAARHSADEKQASPKDEESIDEKAAVKVTTPDSQIDGATDGRINSPDAPASSGRRKRRNTIKSSKKEFRASDDMISQADALEVLKMVQGHLIVWPYDW